MLFAAFDTNNDGKDSTIYELTISYQRKGGGLMQLLKLFPNYFNYLIMYFPLIYVPYICILSSYVSTGKISVEEFGAALTSVGFTPNAHVRQAII